MLHQYIFWSSGTAGYELPDASVCAVLAFGVLLALLARQQTFLASAWRRLGDEDVRKSWKQK